MPSPAVRTHFNLNTHTRTRTRTHYQQQEDDLKYVEEVAMGGAMDIDEESMGGGVLIGWSALSGLLIGRFVRSGVFVVGCYALTRSHRQERSEGHTHTQCAVLLSLSRMHKGTLRSTYPRPHTHTRTHTPHTHINTLAHTHTHVYRKVNKRTNNPTP